MLTECDIYETETFQKNEPRFSTVYLARRYVDAVQNIFKIKVTGSGVLGGPLLLISKLPCYKAFSCKMADKRTPNCSRVFLFLYSVNFLQRSSSQYIVLDPFLRHTNNCWTNLIVYDSTINLFWKVHPAVISTRRHSYAQQDKDCIPHKYHLGTLNNTNDGLCKSVRHNFHQKQITCLAIALVYSNTTKHVRDAYWYIKTYWSNIIWQDYYIHTVPSEALSIKNVVQLNWMDLTPGKIYLQALDPPDVKEWDSDPKRTRNSTRNDIYLDILPVIVFRLKVSKKSGQRDYELTLREAYFDLTCQTLGVVSKSPIDYDFKIQDSSVKAHLEKNHAQIFRRKVVLWVLLFTHKGTEQHEYRSGLSEFLGYSFNETLVFANSHDYYQHKFGLPRNSRRPVFLVLVKHNTLNKVYVSDTKATFQPLEMLEHSIATCAGLKRERLSFREYTHPYDAPFWFTAIALFGILSIGLAMCLTKYSDSVWLIFVSFLLDHCLSISRRLSSRNLFRCIYSAFLLASIVLSHSYKGVVTTSIVKPFRMHGIQSYDVIFKDNFLLYFDPLRAEAYIRATEYVECCKNASSSSNSTVLGPACKHRVIAQLVSSVTYFFTYAALGLYDVERSLKITKQLNTNNIQDIPENLFGGSHNVNAASDTLLIKLIKLLEPPDCPIDDKPPDILPALLECNNSLYILPKQEMDQLIFRAELDPSTYKGLYKIPDERTKEVIPASIAGYNVHFIQYLKHIFNGPIRAFVESGAYRHLVSTYSSKERNIYLNQFRQTFGHLQNLNSPVDGLSFKTKAKLVFIVFAVSVAISTVCFILEMVKQSSTETPPTSIFDRLFNLSGWCDFHQSSAVTNFHQNSVIEPDEIRKEYFREIFEEHILQFPLQAAAQDISRLRWKKSVRKLNAF